MNHLSSYELFIEETGQKVKEAGESTCFFVMYLCLCQLPNTKLCSRVLYQAKNWLKTGFIRKNISRKQQEAA